jgi:hypothetical protein
MVGDLQPIVDLINACSSAAGGTPDHTPQRMHESWGNLVLATDVWTPLRASRHACNRAL